MIRLSYKDAKILLVLLASVSDVGDYDLHRLRRQAAQLQPDLAYFAEDPIYADELKDILKQLAAQVTETENGSEGMLLDEIIRVLQLTGGRGAISKHVLAQLQTAALTQAEMATLAAKMRENRMSCSQCGEELEHGELLACNWLPGNEHTVRCVKCATPVVTRCSFVNQKTGAICKHPVRISKKLAAAIMNIRHYCQDHEDGKEKETVPTPDINAPMTLGRAQVRDDGQVHTDQIFFAPPGGDGGVRIEGLGDPQRGMNPEVAQPMTWRMRQRLRNVEEDLRRRAQRQLGVEPPPPEPLRYIAQEGEGVDEMNWDDLGEDGEDNP